MDRYLSEALTKLERIDREKQLHSDSLARLLQLFRLHLEKNHLQAQYPTTTLYCNWCAHPSLNWSGQAVLEDVLVAMSGSEDEFSQAINRALSLDTLRAEMNQILASAGARSRLLSSFDGWITFLRVLVYLLLEQPLEWHRDPKAAPPSGDYPGTLRIVLEGPGTMLVESGLSFDLDSQTAFWRIDVLPGGHALMGWLGVVESADNFEE